MAEREPRKELSIEALIPSSGVLVLAEQYMQKSARGEKLTTEERRHAVAYIIATFPDISNSQMARWFGCDEGTVRYDVKKIRTDKAAVLREDTDPRLIIADLLAARDRVLRNLARGMREMEETNNIANRTYISFNKEYLKSYMLVTEQLANLGVISRSLGTTSKQKVIYKSYVQSKTGSVETRMVNPEELAKKDALLLQAANEDRPLDLFDDIREGETLEDAILRKAKEQQDLIQDAEFEDVPVAEGDHAQEETTGISETEQSAEADYEHAEDTNGTATP